MNSIAWRLGRLIVSCLLLAGSSLALQAQTITVTAANPNNAPQGTVNLNVLVNGSGFKKGALAKFFISGTTDPGGIQVNSTAFVNSNQLVSNINVASNAVITKFDIVVALTDGRSGKGTQLFAVTANGSNSAACPSMPPMLATTNNCTMMLHGCLDTTFGGSGIALTNTEGGLYNVANSSDQAVTPLLQPDGKIVAVGYDKNGGSTTGVDFTVVRYNSDGTLDTTFGNAGIARDAITTGDDQAEAGALQPDGKILVAGWGANESYMAIARFNPNGTLDNTFGSGGNVLISFVNNPKIGANATAVVLQGDGKILLGGSGSGAGLWTIVRLNTNGAIDTSFGNQGVVSLKLGGGVRGLTTQMISSGAVTEQRILVTGGSQVTRLTSTGGLDISFGPNLDGTASTTCNSPWSIAVDAANNIVVAGTASDPGDYYALNFALSRFTPDGIPDTTFGDPVPGSFKRTGFTTVDFFNANDRVRGLAIQSDGKLLVSGNAEGPNVATTYQIYFALARFNPDGTLDGSFGTGGVVATDYGSPAGNDFGWAVALQADGKIVMAGAAAANNTMNFAVARYWH